MCLKRLRDTNMGLVAWVGARLGGGHGATEEGPRFGLQGPNPGPLASPSLRSVCSCAVWRASSLGWAGISALPAMCQKSWPGGRRPAPRGQLPRIRDTRAPRAPATDWSRSRRHLLDGPIANVFARAAITTRSAVLPIESGITGPSAALNSRTAASCSVLKTQLSALRQSPDWHLIMRAAANPNGSPQKVETPQARREEGVCTAPPTHYGDLRGAGPSSRSE
jgi:hypothetical protein